MSEVEGVRVRRGRKRSSERTQDVDKHIGERIRLRRSLMGMSQTALGEAIGLTFQQVQKYERGANRVGSGLLWHIAKVLDAPVSFFYDGLERDEPSATLGDEAFSRAELALLRRWRRLPATVRDELGALVAALNESGQPEAEPRAVVAAVPQAALPAAAPVVQEMPVQTQDVGMPGAEQPDPAPPGGGAVTGKRRRQHGAVWHPADIK